MGLLTTIWDDLPLIVMMEVYIYIVCKLPGGYHDM